VLWEKLGRLKGWHEHDHDEGGAASSSGAAAVGSRTAGARPPVHRRRTEDPHELTEASCGYTPSPMKIYGVIDDSTQDLVEPEAGRAAPSTEEITAHGAERGAA